MLKIHMVGRASIYNEEELDYEELKELLINHFDKSPTKETNMKILFGRRKKANESVMIFARYKKINKRM